MGTAATLAPWLQRFMQGAQLAELGTTYFLPSLSGGLARAGEPGRRRRKRRRPDPDLRTPLSEACTLTHRRVLPSPLYHL
jgi:hypothetical protein